MPYIDGVAWSYQDSALVVKKTLVFCRTLQMVICGCRCKIAVSAVSK